MSPDRSTDRRAFLGAVSLGAAFFTTRGLFAEELTRTPSRTEGPFYPDHLPLDTDNDLIVLGDSLTPAVGEVAHLHGKILDVTGSPIKDAVIEIWQCDANAVYLHSADSGKKPAQQDKNFQGFGRFTTNSEGEYRFRTIKPVPYPGRPAPHIHFKVKRGDRTLLTSQLMIAGHPGNKTDGVFMHGLDDAGRERLTAEFKPIPDSKAGEFTAAFDVILGRTPDDKALRAIPSAHARRNA
jgi:protocatechuate 3,4-dioxygenase beta subunit